MPNAWRTLARWEIRRLCLFETLFYPAEPVQLARISFWQAGNYPKKPDALDRRTTQSRDNCAGFAWRIMIAASFRLRARTEQANSRE